MNAILSRALALLFAVTVSAPLLAGVGDIDPAFGEGGQLKAGLIAVLKDGRLLIGTSDGYARKTPDGKPDPGFGTNGLQSWPWGFSPASWVNWYESLTYTTPDGSTLVSGYLFDSGSDRYAGAIARLQPDGTLDNNFGEQGVVRLSMSGVFTSAGSIHMPQAVSVQPDGRILVLSFDYISYWSEDGTVYLQRFESDGRRDPAFGTSGELKPAISMSDVMATDSRMQSLPDGRIKIGDATYLDALGQLQGPPAASEIPNIANPGWFSVGRLPGGDSIIARLGDYGASNALRIARVDSAGRPVATFGPDGTGVSIIEAKPGGMIFSSSVSPDGRFAYLATSIPGSQSNLNQTDTFISRVALEGPASGQLDPGFGKSGRVSMSRGVTGLDWFRIIGQADGAAIVGGYLRTLRLLGTGVATPGVVGPSASSWVANTGDSRIELVFSRTGGTDGAVGLHYETYSAEPSPGSAAIAAVAGKDYVSLSGRIEWPDGDGSDKSVFIELPAGVQSTVARTFRVRMDQPTGGAMLASDNADATILAAAATLAPTTSSQPPGAAVPVTRGGGGALDPGMLLICLSMLVHARRARRAG